MDKDLNRFYKLLAFLMDWLIVSVFKKIHAFQKFKY